MHVLLQLCGTGKPVELRLNGEFSMPTVYQCDAPYHIGLSISYDVRNGLLHCAAAEYNIVHNDDRFAVVPICVGTCPNFISFNHNLGMLASVRQDWIQYIVQPGCQSIATGVYADQQQMAAMIFFRQVVRHAPYAPLNAVGVHKYDLTVVGEGTHALLEHSLDASPGSTNRSRSIGKFGLVVHGLLNSAVFHLHLYEVCDLSAVVASRLVEGVVVEGVLLASFCTWLDLSLVHLLASGLIC